MEEDLVGTAIRRREDEHLVTGEATFTDDISVPGMAHAAILRSRYGHARIAAVDTRDAERLDGVLGVFTGTDVEASDAPGIIERPTTVPGAVSTPFPVLSTDVVRYVGDAVAVVVAEDRYTARDALDRVDVEYERLEAVVDARRALSEDSPAVHDHTPDNVSFDWSFGDDEAVERAFEAAERTASVDLRHQRLIGEPMEPRSVLAAFDDGELTVTLSSQAPYRVRAHLGEVLGIDEDSIRVRTPSVGGGFGIKAGVYPDEVVVAWCAMELGRPVKWTSTRSEGHATDYQGRDWYMDGELAFDVDGNVQALRVECQHNVGAYHVFPPTQAGNFHPLLSGQYDIPLIAGRIIGAFTNVTPTGAYRGAGRPQAVYLVERLMDTAARELGMDPAEFRKRNLIPPDAFPYETAVGAVYDSGDYGEALEIALERVDYEEFRARQDELRESGRYLGLGIGSFVENTGNHPGMGETGRVRIDGDGRVTAFLGTQDHGQGHATTFAQLLADELGVEYDDVDIREGDTRDLPGGGGSFASRSAALGGSAVIEAAEEVRDHARDIAADRLEVSPTDLAFDSGEFHVRGAPDRSIHLQEISAIAAESGDVLDATAEYVPPNFGFSFGTHVAIVEVDPESGAVEFERYVAVDDCGVVINPLIVQGQIHGGVAQGIAQALYEEAVFDESGTLVTGSLQDYAVPKADHVPEIETDETVTPSPHNPLGVKGSGESGTIGSTPAVVNAIVDALEPYGVDDVDLPATPETVWRAIHDSQG